MSYNNDGAVYVLGIKENHYVTRKVIDDVIDIKLEFDYHSLDEYELMTKIHDVLIDRHEVIPLDVILQVMDDNFNEDDLRYTFRLDYYGQRAVQEGLIKQSNHMTQVTDRSGGYVDMHPKIYDILHDYANSQDDLRTSDIKEFCNQKLGIFIEDEDVFENIKSDRNIPKPIYNGYSKTQLTDFNHIKLD